MATTNTAPTASPTPDDTVGLLEGLATTRSIRRYTDDPVPESVLRDLCFAATRAPTGSNRQNFRFFVLTEGHVAFKAKHLIGGAARSMWADKRHADRYPEGTDKGADDADSSPKARMALSMDEYVNAINDVPALIFPCLIRHRRPTPTEGASIYPAMQNLLLAARALGFGGVTTMWHLLVEAELRELLEIPDGVLIAATVTLGKPKGRHGPVRRRPLDQFVYDGIWGDTPEWAVDPPDTFGEPGEQTRANEPSNTGR